MDINWLSTNSNSYIRQKPDSIDDNFHVCILKTLPCLYCYSFHFWMTFYLSILRCTSLAEKNWQKVLISEFELYFYGWKDARIFAFVLLSIFHWHDERWMRKNANKFCNILIDLWFIWPILWWWKHYEKEVCTIFTQGCSFCNLFG